MARLGRVVASDQVKTERSYPRSDPVAEHGVPPVGQDDAAPVKIAVDRDETRKAPEEVLQVASMGNIVTTAMTKPSLVVFDMAGTTVVDDGQVPEAFTAALAAHGIAVGPGDIRGVRGAAKRQAILDLLPPGADRERKPNACSPPSATTLRGYIRERERNSRRVRRVQVAARARHPRGAQYRIRPRQPRGCSSRRWAGTGRPWMPLCAAMT